MIQMKIASNYTYGATIWYTTRRTELECLNQLIEKILYAWFVNCYPWLTPVISSTVFPETQIVRFFYTMGSIYHWWHQFQRLAGIICQLIGNRLPKTSTKLFNSSPTAWFSTTINAAAKRNMSRGFRKEYIPGWEQNCENLFQKYKHKLRLLEPNNLELVS
jgi:hypothetical protein